MRRNNTGAGWGILLMVAIFFVIGYIGYSSQHPTESELKYRQHQQEMINLYSKNHSGDRKTGRVYGNSSSSSSISRSKSYSGSSAGGTSRTYGSNTYKPGSSTKSEKTVDPMDHDIESYYLDYQDEFEDEDDAWDDFEDDPDVWDDY